MSVAHLLCSPVDRFHERCFNCDSGEISWTLEEEAPPDGGQHVLVLLNTNSLTKAEGVMRWSRRSRRGPSASDPLAKHNGSQKLMSCISEGSFISSIFHSSSQLHLVNSSNRGGWFSWKSSSKTNLICSE